MRPLSEVKSTLEEKGHRTLLATLVLMLLASPFLSDDAGLNWLLSVFLMLVLLAAARTVAQRKRSYLVALILGTLALFSHVGVLSTEIYSVATIRYASTALFLYWVCFLLLRNIVLRIHSVTLELVLGAVNVYLMLGVGFSFTYGLIEHLQPGSFTGLEELAATTDPVSYFLYFSFITLSTLGYGDISPLTPYGMTVSYLEAIFGQLYLAILVARLVAMYIGTRKEDQH